MNFVLAWKNSNQNTDDSVGQSLKFYENGKCFPNFFGFKAKMFHLYFLSWILFNR